MFTIVLVPAESREMILVLTSQFLTIKITEGEKNIILGKDPFQDSHPADYPDQAFTGSRGCLYRHYPQQFR